MALMLAQIVVAALALYLAVGVVFAVAFVLRGVGAVDPAAKDATWGFRLVILPGVAALWPLMALRWKAGGPPPVEQNAHRAAATTAGGRS